MSPIFTHYYFSFSKFSPPQINHIIPKSSSSIEVPLCFAGAHAAPNPVRPRPLSFLHHYYAMAFSNNILVLFILLSCCSCFVLVSSADESNEAQILLKFKASLSPATALDSWNLKTQPCNEGNVANWKGVMCDGFGGILGLKLEGMKLKGTLDFETLKQLPELRTLSLKNNEFEGPLPDIKKLSALKSLYLSKNHFSGVIPGNAFEGMSSVKKVHLAQNGFTGEIPGSLASLPKLIELRLEDNKFEGKIPEFKQKEAIALNVSNNALDGPIPPGMSKLDKSAFAGNKDICGEPLKPCAAATPPPLAENAVSDASSGADLNSGTDASSGTDINSGTNASADAASGTASSDSNKKTSLLTIIVVSLVVLVALIAILAATFILCCRKRSPNSLEAPPPSNLQKKVGVKESNDTAAEGSVDGSNNGRKGADNALKLSFVRDDKEKFDLSDLLKASAEILGSGCFGSSYKAALTSGAMMVVKRFKQMNNVGREEFHEHMRRLGRLRHANMLPLVAYYYRKEEKLLVNDYVTNGSLAVHLHGHQSLGHPGLDWPTRLKIVKGVAKGLAYLYKELPSLIAPHGHLKSSNVLLNESYEPFVTDYGLIPVINQESAQDLMVAYKSPEYLQQGRITKKTDVWGLGMLILEILTGKFPANFLQQGNKDQGQDQDLASWVNSMIDQDKTATVFDKDMGCSKKCEGEMLKLLQIALACCEADVDKRLDIKEAVQRIEEVKERGDGNKSVDEDFFSICADDSDIKASSDDLNV
ncbi:hypothetical protein ACFE04_016834 [Oxalis oulophora]